MNRNIANKPVRLGIIGCGRVFERYHLPALRLSPAWELAAVCEPLKERCDWLQTILPNVAVFDSFTAFMAQAAVDAVLITTPPATHADLAIASLARGLHVLVEKPMALTLTEAELMLTASLQAQRQLWIGFNRRFRRPYRQMKQALALAPRDRIQGVYFELILDSQKWKPITAYMGQESQGGGVLDDVASHQLDLLAWLFDQPIVSIKAEQILDKTAGLEGVKYQLKFGNGLAAECLAAHGPTYSENLAVQLEDRKLLAYPSGLLETKWLPPNWVDLYRRLSTTAHLAFHKLTKTPNVTIDSFREQFNAFAATIRGEPADGADARSGFDSLQAIQACRVSLQAGGYWQELVLHGETLQ